MVAMIIGVLATAIFYCFGDTLKLSCLEYWFYYTASFTLALSAFVYRIWSIFALHRIAAAAVAHAVDSDNTQLKQSLWFLLHKDYLTSTTSAVVAIVILNLIGLLPLTMYFVYHSSLESAAFESLECDSAYYPIFGYNTIFGLVSLSIAAYLMRGLEHTENLGIKQELTLYAYNGVLFSALQAIFHGVQELDTRNSTVVDFLSRVILPILATRFLYDCNMCIFGDIGVAAVTTIDSENNYCDTPRSTRIGSPRSGNSPRSGARSQHSSRARSMRGLDGDGFTVGRSKNIPRILDDINFMLTDAEGFNVLTKLAIAEYTVESVLFLKAVIELRYANLDEWTVECQRIQSLFLLDSSPLCLNLSSEARNEANSGVEQLNAEFPELDLEIFDRAYTEISKMFAIEVWSRIMKHRQFKEYATSLARREVPSQRRLSTRITSQQSESGNSRATVISIV